jgi:hypothetical protein
MTALPLRRRMSREKGQDIITCLDCATAVRLPHLQSVAMNRDLHTCPDEWNVPPYTPKRNPSRDRKRVTA